MVGKGELGSLHPHCLISCGLFGLLGGNHQTLFEEGLHGFLQRYGQNSHKVEALWNKIPSPNKTIPNKGVRFYPRNYVLNATPGSFPGRFPDRILQIMLDACQLIRPSMTLDDLGGGSVFTGTLAVLHTHLHMEEGQHPFIDSMRGISTDQRASQHDKNLPTKDRRKNKHKTKSEVCKRNQSIQHQDVVIRHHNKKAKAAASAFVAPDVDFNEDRLIRVDPNESKTEVRQELLKLMDENWSPRLETYDENQCNQLTNQVRSGLILSEVIIKQRKYYALHGTMIDPLGSSWVKVDGHQGILTAATTLKEKAGMFKDVTLLVNDCFVWLNYCISGVIRRMQIKCGKNGKPGIIPEGTWIYLAVVDTNSVYYNNLTTFTGKSGTCIENHAMYAIHRDGPFVIPSYWVKFQYFANEKIKIVKHDGYTPPNPEDLADLVTS